MLAWLRIIALCTLAAVLYGVAHDQVTARVSLEYFTIGHPRLFRSDSPTLHALGWGVIATWWMGVLLGVAIAVAARARAWPRLAWRDLVKPVAVVMLIMAAGALVFGLAGGLLFDRLHMRLWPDMAGRIDPAGHAAFFGVWCAHNASYFLGAVGGAAVCFWIVIQRGRRAVAAARAGHAL